MSDTTEAAPEDGEAKPKTRGRLLVVATAIVVIAVIGTVVAVTRGGDDKSTNLGLRDASNTSTTSASTSTSAADATGLTDPTTTTSSSIPGATTTTGVAQNVKPSPTVSVPKRTTTTQVAASQATGPCNSGAGVAAANRIADLFCERRASSGLPVMRRTAAMDSVAQSWANQLAANNPHQIPPPHNPNYGSQVLAACPACSGWAENVGYWEADEPDSIWNAWLNSSIHRQNIDDSHAGEYGIGVAYSSDGYLWVVHDFGRY